MKSVNVRKINCKYPYVFTFRKCLMYFVASTRQHLGIYRIRAITLTNILVVIIRFTIISSMYIYNLFWSTCSLVLITVKVAYSDLRKLLRCLLFPIGLVQVAWLCDTPNMNNQYTVVEIPPEALVLVSEFQAELGMMESMLFLGKETPEEKHFSKTDTTNSAIIRSYLN